MFDKKTVFITGASSGLGRALAIEMSKNGANLALLARNREGLEETVRLCEKNGRISPIIIVGDIGIEQVCEEAIQRILSHFGRLDYLILNAGVSMSSTFEALSDVSVLRKLMETNYLGVAQCVFYALPHLKLHKGMVVAISSIQGKIPVPKHSGYCASKHALESFLEVIRMESKKELDILTVCPGWIKGTKLKENSFKDKNSSLSQTALDRQNQEALSLDYCVHHIVNAMLARKKELILPVKYRFLPWLKLICPPLLQFLMERRLESNNENAKHI